MNLNRKMNRGIGGIVRTAGRFYRANPAARSFLAHTLPMIQRGARVRARQEKEGTHIPPFLIASIATQCNLRCAGCYARENGACCDETTREELTAAQWSSLFDQAASLGISFVLLAGGEPLIRRDVIAAAAQQPNMIFPIFTNGTMIDEAYEDLFDACRTLIPVFSIEGDGRQTDERRGAGTYAQVARAMERLHNRGILFGASITVTRENLADVTAESFLSDLRKQGCGAVFLVEYVPAAPGTEHLALKAEDLRRLQSASRALKRRFDDMIVLTFPGDEAAMGGCLASGRGFFHINPYGDAEPCPFSANARDNLRTASIKDVLNSCYFRDLRALSASIDPHAGGCALFAHQNQVQALLSAEGSPA